MIINKNTKLSDIVGLEKLTIGGFNQIAYCIDRCKHTGLVLDLNLEDMTVTVIEEEKWDYYWN